MKNTWWEGPVICFLFQILVTTAFLSRVSPPTQMESWLIFNPIPPSVSETRIETTDTGVRVFCLQHGWQPGLITLHISPSRVEGVRDFGCSWRHGR